MLESTCVRHCRVVLSYGDGEQKKKKGGRTEGESRMEGGGL